MKLIFNMPQRLPTDVARSEQIVRVSVSEAARLFGVASRTIRRAIADGKIRYIIVRGRYRLHFESLLTWSQSQPTVRHKRDRAGIGQWVDQWKIKNPKFSPRPPVPGTGVPGAKMPGSRQNTR